jgi:hypothetical protein
MSKNSIKSVFKNAEIEKIYALLENLIKSKGLQKLKESIIKTLKEKDKIEIEIEDFEKEKAGLNKKDFAKFLNICVDEIEKLESKIGIIFEQIHELSNAKVIDDVEKILHNLLKSEHYEKIENANAYHRTIDLFLEFPKHFAHLHYTFEANKVSGKFWHERKINDFEKSKNDILDKKDTLKKAIKMVLEVIGKGQFCDVETFECGFEKWFVISIDGALHTEGVIEKGKKDYISYKPEEHIIFVFNEREKRMQTLAKFPDKQVLQFEKAFGDAVLNVDISKYPSKNDAFNVAEVYKRILRNGSLNFNITDAQIKNLYARQIKLQHISNGSIITLSNSKIEKDGDIFKELEQYKLTEKHQNETMIGEEYEVKSVGFVVHYKLEGYKKTLNKSFSINNKGQTNLDMNTVGMIVRDILHKNKI